MQNAFSDGIATIPALPAASAAPVVQWLLAEGRRSTDIRALIAELARRMNDIGVPVARINISIPTLHPLVYAHTYRWTRGMDQAEQTPRKHTIRDSPEYQVSPLKPVYEENRIIRRRLDVPSPILDFPILKEFQEQGLTDYLALPAQGRVGHRMAVTWATDRPGGFDEDDIARLGGILPVLSLVLEIHSQESITRTLLDTYIGRHSGTRVLDGSIRRGSGETIHAALWMCDLRGSTEMAEHLPRDAMLGSLNAFFEAVVERVHNHGGEVLKFMGDGLLAIFRPDLVGEGLCVCNAIDAADEAFGAVDTLNAARIAVGEPALRFGLGLHLGDVMYGNIGAPDRLDFTVIGPAVNLVSRLEGLTKTVNRPLLMSSEFAKLCPRPTQSLGRHALRGVAEPHEVFALS